MSYEYIYYVKKILNCTDIILRSKKINAILLQEQDKPVISGITWIINTNFIKCLHLIIKSDCRPNPIHCTVSWTHRHDFFQLTWWMSWIIHVLLFVLMFYFVLIFLSKLLWIWIWIMTYGCNKWMCNPPFPTFSISCSTFWGNLKKYCGGESKKLQLTNSPNSLFSPLSLCAINTP